MTARFKVPRGWVSGYYLARLVRTDGTQAGESGRVPFIVRPPAWARPRILVVVPVNTWEAYNAWGGKNLYYNSSSGHHPATHVSFNRPFLGRGVIFLYEYQLVRFLERQGYDVGYVTDLDVDRDPSLLRRARMVIVAGHGEYWSATERLALEAAPNHGVNVIFTGANTGYWRMRYERGRHVMVAYKRLHDPTHDPRLWTKKFRHLMPPQPECRLLGVMYMGGEPERTADAEAVSALPFMVTPAATRSRWMRGTGLRAGGAVAVVGGEWDRTVPGCRRATVLFHYGGRRPADAVTYRHRSGATVFSAGSLQFSWGLDLYRYGPVSSPANRADPRLQRFMCNLVRDLSQRGRRVSSRASCRVEGA